MHRASDESLRESSRERGVQEKEGEMERGMIDRDEIDKRGE